jgi:hypothetical protein
VPRIARGGTSAHFWRAPTPPFWDSADEPSGEPRKVPPRPLVPQTRQATRDCRLRRWADGSRRNHGGRVRPRPRSIVDVTTPSWLWSPRGCSCDSAGGHPSPSSWPWRLSLASLSEPARTPDHRAPPSRNDTALRPPGVPDTCRYGRRLPRRSRGARLFRHREPEISGAARSCSHPASLASHARRPLRLRHRPGAPRGCARRPAPGDPRRGGASKADVLEDQGTHDDPPRPRPHLPAPNRSRGPRGPQHRYRSTASTRRWSSSEGRSSSLENR